jgi:hypothetical protein
MPRMKLLSDKGADKLKFGLDHGDQRIGDLLLADGLGISEPSFLGGYLNGVIRASTAHSADDLASANSILGAIYGMKPCDEAEAMLIAQMVATHDLAMTFAGQAARAENIPQQDAAVNGLTKLTRTYAAQMAELKHYRTGGEQRVIVQRVDVREGGQAVVVGGVDSGRGAGGRRRVEGNLMQNKLPMHEAPRCCARSKRSGLRCQAPAVKGRRTCRMHGGTNPGAPTGKGNGSYQHGVWTKEWLELRRQLSTLRRQWRST